MEECVYQVSIEIYEKYGKEHWAQARYLVHGITDLTWTNSLEEALSFLRIELNNLVNNYKWEDTRREGYKKTNKKK